MMLSSLAFCLAVSFASSERTVCFGDSITAAGGYVSYLQLFSTLRHPESEMRWFNAGNCGDTAQGALARWERDGKPLSPDRVFVMFGMNDCQRDTLANAAPTNLDDAARRADIVSGYRGRMDVLLNLLKKDCKEVVVMTPTPYDQYGPQDCKAFNGVNEPMLTDFAYVVRDLAAVKGMRVVDLHRAMTKIIRTNRHQHLIGGDRVHPSDEGQFLMACLCLEELDADGAPKATVVDARGRKAFEFEYEPKSLPLPVTDVYREVEKVWPVTDRINRELLVVPNLPDGRYALVSEGCELGQFTAAELERGVNLALLDTPNSRESRRAEKLRMRLCEIASEFRFVDYIDRRREKAKVLRNDTDALAKFLAGQRELAKTIEWGEWHLKCLDKYEAMIPKWDELLLEQRRVRSGLLSIRPVGTRFAIRPVAGTFADGKGLFNRRLGMFVHWGVYSVGGYHEQTMWMKDMSRPEYQRYVDEFTAERFDANRLVDVAESAGAEYIVITAKHHDGFCMWDTATTDFCAPKSPAKRDLIGEVATACHRRGMGLGFYYSNPDWHCPFSNNPKSTHQLRMQPGDVSDLERYAAYEKDQIRELLTKYGDVCCWFWDIPTGVRRPEMDELVRSLQAGILINDRGWELDYHIGGDYSTPERDFNQGGVFTNLIEACNSVGRQSWGYRANEDYHTVGSLTRGIDGFLASGGNYLLNVGPKSDGTLSGEAVRAMARVGDWYRRVRESFHDVKSIPRLMRSIRNSPFKWVKDHDEYADYFLTRRGDVLYVHFPNGLNETGVDLAPLAVKPIRSVLLNTGDVLRSEVDMLPCNRFFYDKASLHVWGIPADDLVNECVVLKLEFPPNALSGEL